jgi:hypothetical protein
VQPQLSYFHDGPLFAYLAKSPEQSTEGLRKWDGDGDFFKIEQRGPDDDIGWWTSIRYDMDVLYSEVRTGMIASCEFHLIVIVEFHDP